MLRELRAAGYLCQLTGADYKRPLGFFTTSLHLRNLLSLGWPYLENQHGNLRYKGPLRISCYCGRNHSPLIGITDTDEFQTSTSVALGPKFWDLCVFDHSLETRFNSLRDGGQTDLAPLAAVGIDPLFSVSLASGIGSLRPGVRGMESWDTFAERACRYSGLRRLQQAPRRSGFAAFLPIFFATLQAVFSLAGYFGPG